MLHSRPRWPIRLSLSLLFCTLAAACGRISPGSMPADLGSPIAVFATSTPCVTPTDPALAATDRAVAAANQTASSPLSNPPDRQPSEVLLLCAPTALPTLIPPTATPFPPAACLPADALGPDQIYNGGFELGTIGWMVVENEGKSGPHSLVVVDGSVPPRTGHGVARLGGAEAQRDVLQQQVTIPPAAMLSYWYQVPSQSYAFVTVGLNRPDGTPLVTLAIYQRGDSASAWRHACFDVSAYQGQDLVLEFAHFNDNTTDDYSLFDDVSLHSRR